MCGSKYNQHCSGKPLVLTKPAQHPSYPLLWCFAHFCTFLAIRGRGLCLWQMPSECTATAGSSKWSSGGFAQQMPLANANNSSFGNVAGDSQPQLVAANGGGGGIRPRQMPLANAKRMPQSQQQWQQHWQEIQLIWQCSRRFPATLARDSAHFQLM